MANLVTRPTARAARKSPCDPSALRGELCGTMMTMRPTAYSAPHAPRLKNDSAQPVMTISTSVVANPNAAAAMKWVRAEALREHDMPPADVVLVERLIERSAA